MLDCTRNIEAEQAVLGSVLLEGELIKELSLAEYHFSDIRHQRIYRAMLEVDRKGHTVDLVTVTSQLGNAINDVGGVDYLSDLANSVPSTAAVFNYQRLVFEAYRLREWRNMALAFVNNPNDDDMLKMYERATELFEMGARKEKSEKEVLMEIYEETMRKTEGLTGITTGFTDLDDMTGGLQGGDLIIVAGRPSTGKTALAINIGINAAQKDKAAVDIFSLEMPKKQLIRRSLSQLGNIEGIKWRDPYNLFTDEDRYRLTYAMSEFNKLCLSIHDEPKQTVADIRAAVRSTKRKHPDKKHLVIIDYLQLITPIGRFERHDLAIGSITRELKQMAMTFDVPVVLLSQLNRGVEQRAEKRPMMSDLRDSGSIEQDADVIMLLYREDYYDKDTERKNIIEINIAKQRNGPVGNVELVFLKEFNKFHDIARNHVGE